jgi:tRNA dimethylallyltransferase
LKGKEKFCLDAVLIAGPTASGKSAAALQLAEALRGTIINADSMQVYAELPVLTARPSAADEARLPHRLYGHVSAVEGYSAGRYQEESAHALTEARREGRVAIFTGGTGLYFDVLTKGLSPIPAVPPDIREQVRRKFESLGRETFFTELVERDPATGSKLRASDTQRVLRAAEVLEATGRPLSQWQAMTGKPVLAGMRVLKLVIAPPRAILFERIDRRFETMIRHGALDEAASLMGLDPTLPAAKALGLSQLWRHLAGEITIEAAIVEAQLATKRYVKRQMTWFRNRMSGWEWLDHSPLSNKITSTRGEIL